jgi:hypothetical protein
VQLFSDDCLVPHRHSNKHAEECEGAAPRQELWVGEDSSKAGDEKGACWKILALIATFSTVGMGRRQNGGWKVHAQLSSPQ